MLLEDEGWDLDLLSNNNKEYRTSLLRLKNLRPYWLSNLRRLRRLRRLRLMSINLYLHRSYIVKKNNCAPYQSQSQSASISTSTSTSTYPDPSFRAAILPKGISASVSASASESRADQVAISFARLQSNQEKQVADLEPQARNHSNIYKASCDYSKSQPQPLTPFSASIQSKQNNNMQVGIENSYKRFNNKKYLIKHNDNKLKFIIN